MATLQTMTKADTISGGAHNDVLCGYNGNDSLNGGTGSDMLLGGAGNDTLVYNSNDGLIYREGDHLHRYDAADNPANLRGGQGNDAFEASYPANSNQLGENYSNYDGGYGLCLVNTDGTGLFSLMNGNFPYNDYQPDISTAILLPSAVDPGMPAPSASAEQPAAGPQLLAAVQSVQVSAAEALSALAVSSDVPLYDLALLARDVYTPHNTVGGWTLVFKGEDTTTGFFAAAYKRDDDVVISFRGTDHGPDWTRNNVNMLFSQNPVQASEALAFAQEVIKLYPNSQYSITGHSLGGALAQIVAADISNGIQLPLEGSYGDNNYLSTVQYYVGSGYSQDRISDHRSSDTPSLPRMNIATVSFNGPGVANLYDDSKFAVPINLWGHTLPIVTYVHGRYGQEFPGQKNYDYIIDIDVQGDTVGNLLGSSLGHQITFPQGNIDVSHGNILGTHNLNNFIDLLSGKDNSVPEIVTSLRDGDDPGSSAADQLIIGTDSCRDIIASDAGDDIISGRKGNDVIRGGEGDDILLGDDGNDILNGGNGNDLLYGGNGRDNLNGGDNNDMLSGGNGGDNLSGGSGNDTLNGQAGSDNLTGGSGNDVYIYDYYDDPGSGIYAGYDTITQSAGNSQDTIYFTKEVALSDLSLHRSNDSLVIRVHDNINGLCVAGFFEGPAYQPLFEFEIEPGHKYDLFKIYEDSLHTS